MQFVSQSQMESTTPSYQREKLQWHAQCNGLRFMQKIMGVSCTLSSNARNCQPAPCLQKHSWLHLAIPHFRPPNTTTQYCHTVQYPSGHYDDHSSSVHDVPETNHAASSLSIQACPTITAQQPTIQPKGLTCACSSRAAFSALRCFLRSLLASTASTARRSSGSRVARYASASAMTPGQQMRHCGIFVNWSQ